MIQKLFNFTLILVVQTALAHSNQLQPIIFFENDLKAFWLVDDRIIHSGTDAYIRIVADGNALFILKQICDESLDEQFLLMNDCLASTIGYQCGININQVSFIPYNVGAHLKKYPERAATLHSYVPGVDLESCTIDFLSVDFSLQQRVVDKGSPWQKKYPVSKKSARTDQNYY